MTNDQFHIVARYRTQAGQENEVLRLLAKMAEASRAEPGNLAYDYYQSPVDSRDIVILETYGTDQDFAAHHATEHFTALGTRGIIPLLESRTVTAYRETPLG